MHIVLLSCLIYFAVPLLVSYWVAKRFEKVSIILLITTSFIVQQIFLILISKIVKDYLCSLIISEIILLGGVISLRSWFPPSVSTSEKKVIS